MELAGDSTQVSIGDNSSDGFKTPKAKRGRSKSVVVSVPSLSLSPSPQRNGTIIPAFKLTALQY